MLRAAGSRSGGNSPVAVVLIDDEAVAGFGPLPWPRVRLARLVDAIRSAGARAVVVDLILSEDAHGGGDFALAEALGKSQVAIAAALDGDGDWLCPLDVFGGVNVAAHAYGEVGPDGVVRTFAATKQARGLALPALSLAAARLMQPDIPIAPGAEIRPAFRPAPQDIRSFGARSVLSGAFPDGELTDRLVFIGIAATGAGDQFVVPTGPRHTPVPGVLAHASAAASILSGALIRTSGVLFMLISGFALALAVQILRGRRGEFDVLRFTALAGGLGVLAVISLRLAHIMLPAAFLFSAMVVSALLREAVESRAAQLESGRLLQTLLRHVGAEPLKTEPRTAHRRLQSLQRLQDRVIAEDAARKALLAGMEEGVVLWDHQRRLVQANAAARRLWGRDPSLDEIKDQTNPGESGDAGIFRRAQKDLAVFLTEVENGTMALIRDVTAELELERRRSEVQRLVSHELKTPLSSIAGFGETLERYEMSSEEIHRVAGMIRGEAGRLQEMVSAFLDLERLEAGHWQEEIETVDLGSLIAGRIAILGASAESKGQSVDFKDGGDSLVRGVPALLDRLVDNLVGNAIKYSSDGDRIEITLDSHEQRVIMTIQDHGPGIPGDSLEKIFDRFYRVPGTKPAGAGLGLALAKEAVDWHGGCMTIDSTVGVGSTFTVDLPAHEED
jgi:signal transduction histidine kinase